MRLSAAGEGVFTVLGLTPQGLFFRNMTFFAGKLELIVFARLFFAIFWRSSVGALKSWALTTLNRGYPPVFHRLGETQRPKSPPIQPRPTLNRRLNRWAPCEIPVNRGVNRPKKVSGGGDSVVNR